MKVSVLVPVYNVEPYVEVAIQSIINQKYKDLEIIIVDDCSTDKTYEICSRLSEADPRIRLLRNKRNRKICYSLNRAFKESSGEFIARMDGDDISLPDRIDRKVEYLARNPDIDIVGCSVIAINSIDEYIGKTTHYADFEFLKRTSKYVSPCSHIWVARRKVYEELNGYREIPGAEDYDFLLRAITRNFYITNLEDYFGYKVRLARAGNTTFTIGARQRLLQAYVYELYLQRLASGYDDFSKSNMHLATKQSKFSSALFSFSNTALLTAIQKTSAISMPIKIIYILFAICSPIVFRYLVNRLKYKFLCMSHKS